MKRKGLIVFGVIFAVVLVFSVKILSAETMDFESGIGWIDTCPNYNEFFINNWQFEPYPSHSLCRSTEEYRSGTHSIMLSSSQGAAAGPHIRYNGPKFESFYQAMWIKVVSGEFGGSGNALKLMGSRPAIGENELMALGYDSNNFRIAMSTSIGSQTWFHFFNSQSASDPLILPYNEWHYIKLFQNNDGDFDAWVNGVHVATTNSMQSGNGIWNNLPMSNWAVTSTREIIWWNLNYCGGGPLTDIVYFEDDMYYGETDPGYPNGATDTTPPTITITLPTSGTTYTTTSSTINLGGTASDNIGVSSVTWTNSRGGSGTASGTTSWTANGITLYSGSNVLTVTSHDTSGNTGTDVLTVTYNIPSTCTSGADTNFNSVVEIGELMNYISSWKSGSVVIGDLMNAIGEWKNGC